MYFLEDCDEAQVFYSNYLGQQQRKMATMH